MTEQQEYLIREAQLITGSFGLVKLFFGGHVVIAEKIEENPGTPGVYYVRPEFGDGLMIDGSTIYAISQVLGDGDGSDT